MNICDLCPELILCIFNYCNLKSLCNLRCCCKKFNEIIISSKKYAATAIVTNQMRKTFIDRCHIVLESNEKWRISYNWKIGRYKKTLLFKQFVKYMPWLNLNKDLLWISRGQVIKAYKRLKDTLNLNPYFYIRGQSEDDVTKFVYRNGLLLSGVRGGGLWLYSTSENRMLFDMQKAHASDVMCVDLNNEIFVTGSKDKTFKIWSLNPLNDLNELEASHEVDIGDKVLSIGISPLSPKLAVGSAGLNNIEPLHLYDLETHKLIYSLGSKFQYGAGTLDLHWESENILLSCGYDTHLRMWDTRIGKCVRCWMDPHDSAYYCLASDNLFSFMCGSSFFGRVVLWDQRQDNYVQMYYTHRSTNAHRSSPVYSMSFDSCQLFAALDTCMASLDFTVKKGKVLNYNIFS